MFFPNENMSRAEIATLIVKAFDFAVTKNTSVVFDDVEKDDWFYSYVITLKEKGIMQGESNNLFVPDDSITRADICTLIYRIYLSAHSDVDGSNEVSMINDGKFADDDEIPDYALDAVHFAMKNNIVNGVGNNRFAPKDFCTRAMAAQIIYKTICFMEGKI